MVDVAQGNIGPEAKYDVSFSQGKLNITSSYQGKQAGLNVTGYVDGAALLAALEAAVANPTEKMLIDGLKGIVASIP